MQSNSVNTAYIAWRLNPTARQFIAETTQLGQTDVPPGGTFMPARQFLGRFPEFYAKQRQSERETHAFLHNNTY